MKHIVRIALSVSLVLGMIGCGPATTPEVPVPEPVQAAPVPALSEPSSAGTRPVPATTADRNRLAGTWERTDAPYQLVISDIASDGTMKTTYLNPNPINVSKSNWVDGKGVMSVFVELLDVNYPGSNYTITYYPDRDMLIGKYFQAVQGMTYDVAFSRVK